MVIYFNRGTPRLPPTLDVKINDNKRINKNEQVIPTELSPKFVFLFEVWEDAKQTLVYPLEKTVIGTLWARK